MRREIKKSYYFIIVFLLISLFFPLLYKANVVNFDSEMIVRPLVQVHSMSDYFTQRAQNNIFDIAPVRDLSHLIDLSFFNLPSFNLDIFHNLLLWIFTLFLIYLILREWSVSTFSIFLVILLLSIHPSLLQTIVWVSARKHILATMFLLLTIYFEIKNRRDDSNINRIAIFTFYLLSILSWPILILYPLYYLIFTLPKIEVHKSEKVLVAVLVLAMVIVLYFNINFYQNQFTSLLGVEKAKSQISIGLSLLGLGRSFLQTIFPFFIAIAYGPNSILNIIGLVLFPIASYFYYEKIELKEFFRYLIFYFLPLATVLTFPTAIFLMDSYVFFSTIVFWMFFARAIDFFIINNFKIGLVTAGVIVSFFYYKDFVELSLRLNEHAYVENSFQVDKNCISYGIHILQKWEEGNVNESILEFKKFTEMGCKKSNLQQIYLYTIFIDEQFSTQEKKKILSVHTNNSFLATILLLGVDYKSNPDQVVSDLNNLFKNNLGKTIRVPFDKKNDPLFKYLIKNCENNLKLLSNNADCREFLLNLDKHIIRH